MKTTLKVLALVLCAGAAMAQKEDAGHGKDYRTFHANGEIEYGSIEDSYTSDLVMYLAGNQFMVMEELITAFQEKNPDIETVYVETIPPGQILKNQLLKQGDIIEIDIPKRSLNVRLGEEEIQTRLSRLPEFEMKVKTGYLARYAHFVSSADKGAVFPK